METLGPYQILRELGRGGCGTVFLALDPRIGRKVAIKTVLSVSDSSLSESLRVRFRREAQAAGGLSHPHIVTIHEYDDNASMAYLVMEFVDGVTLAQKMETGAPLPLDFVLSVLDAASAALDFAHAQNVVHRDVKPANFLIAHNGVVKIADFGIAKILDADTGGLTATGTLVGTVYYMSPEQVAARPITGRSDQFSLAVIAYEMLAGRKPFMGDSWATVLHQIMSVHAAPLNQFREDLDDSVTAVLQKALSKDEKDRYVDCESFVQALREASGLGVPQRTLRLPVASSSKIGVSSPLGMEDATQTLAYPLADATLKAATGTPAPVPLSPPPPSPKGRPTVVAGIAAAALLAASVIGYRVWVSHSRSAPTAVSIATGPAAAPTSNEPASSPSAVNGPAQDKSSKLAPPVSVIAPQKTPVPVASKGGAVEARPKAIESQPPPAPEVPPTSPNPPAEIARTPVQTPVPTPAPPQPAPVPAPAKQENRTPQPDPRALEADAWERVRTSTDVASLERFRAAFPNGSFHADATRRIEQLEYEQASRTNTAKAYREFLAKYPSGANSERASAELAKLDRAAQVSANRHLVDAALQTYRQAFERKDAALLKTVWPGLSASDFTSFQNFFRIARSIKLELQLTGEPDIAADGATVRCRRILTAADERGPLPTQDQMVTIRLRKSGEAMLIESVQTAGR